MEIFKNNSSNQILHFSYRFSKLTLLILIFLNILIGYTKSRQAKSHLVQEEEFPELSDEEIIRAKQQFVNEVDIDQRGYLEPVIKPEKFDMNKDRKISKEELKKAIKFAIFPKDSTKRKQVTEELKDHVNNQVDLYVNNLNFESLNYRQFGKLMNRIVADKFVNFEVMTNVHMKSKEIREIENDL